MNGRRGIFGLTPRTRTISIPQWKRPQKLKYESVFILGLITISACISDRERVWGLAQVFTLKDSVRWERRGGRKEYQSIGFGLGPCIRRKHWLQDGSLNMIKKNAQRHGPRPIPIDWYHFLPPSFSSETTFKDTVEHKHIWRTFYVFFVTKEVLFGHRLQCSMCFLLPAFKHHL